MVGLVDFWWVGGQMLVCVPTATRAVLLSPHPVSANKRSALLESELGVYVEKAKRLSVSGRPSGVPLTPPPHSHALSSTYRASLGAISCTLHLYTHPL